MTMTSIVQSPEEIAQGIIAVHSDVTPTGTGYQWSVEHPCGWSANGYSRTDPWGDIERTVIDALPGDIEITGSDRIIEAHFYDDDGNEVTR